MKKQLLNLHAVGRHILPMALVALSQSAYAYFVLDWNKIEHWVGEGGSRSALIVQFNTPEDPHAHVWGFRWNSDDYDAGAPSGEDMFRAVAAGCPDILLFTQYTGWMGCTVDGIGYFDPQGEHLADHLSFDFTNASKDEKISFDYFSPNVTMGQTKAPGNFTTQYCKRAIAESKEHNILEHPIDAREYGYPAYDYDYWSADNYVKENAATMQWRSGWYDGYWSYWVGGIDSDDLSYSGLGMSSRRLADGQVDFWSFTPLDRNSTSYGEAVEPGELPLDYAHEFTGNTLVGSDMIKEDTSGEIYTLNGRKTGFSWPSDTDKLSAGIYIIIVPGHEARKIMISE